MGQVQLMDGSMLTYDDQFSFGNFVNSWIFTMRRQDNSLFYDLSGKTIYSSSFYHEIPNSEIFPADMTGVTYVECNLDNVLIPDGNTCINCSRKQFKANPSDNNTDWLIDNQGNFLSPLNP